MKSLRAIKEESLAEVAKVIGVKDALMLQKISHRLHQLDEQACNWGLTERQEKRETHLEKEAEEIVRQYGLRAYHQGDPRGWSLYLVDSTLEEIDRDYTMGLAICPF